MLRPLYAVLLDGGYLTKKLYERLNRHPTADDVVAECERLQALPIVSEYELLVIAHPLASGLKA